MFHLKAAPVWRPLASGAGCFLLACLAGGGLAGEPASGPLVFDVWQTEHGLPQNHVTSIVQSRDGYLWLGSYNGLVRFDGVRFVVFDSINTPSLISSRVTALFEDVQGRLWIGHEGGEVTQMSQGRFELVRAVGADWPSGKVLGLAEDRDRNLWVLSARGLLKQPADGPGRVVELWPAEDRLVSLARDELGRLWRVQQGVLRPLDPAIAKPRFGNGHNGEFIGRACARRAGGLWLTGAEHVLSWTGSAGETSWLRCPWESDWVTCLMETRDGVLWVGTLHGGLFGLRKDGSVEHFTHADGLPHDWVLSLEQDREGTLWVVTAGGLCAGRVRQVRMVGTPDGWRGRAVLGTAVGPTGQVWAGTEGGGIYRGMGDRFSPLGSMEGLSNQFVWAVLEDKAGRLWAGTWGGGLFVRDGGEKASFQRPAGFDPVVSLALALFEDRRGGIWVGTGNGLAHLEAGRWEWFGKGLPSADVRAIAEDVSGRIWFGMAGGGLACLREGVIEQFRKADGLPSDYVWALHARENGDLWLGTFGGGLGRWRAGQCVAIRAAQGLPHQVICHLAEDGLGNLWMSSYGGIMRARLEDLDACVEGKAGTVHFQVLGKTDGLTTLECSGGFQPAGGRTGDRRLWFPTNKGLATIQPELVRTNPLAPPVVIEALRVDGQNVDLGQGGGGEAARSLPLRIPPGKQRFEFQFAGLSFVAPDRVRFRYRLDGLEKAWVEGGNQRSVNYGFLAPGDYVFHLTACNSDGVWNPKGVSLAFTVLPFFWQTWWFGLGLGLAGAGVLGLVVRTLTRQRYRQKLERVQQQRELEKERARIARDIHDDLGASLTRITLLSQTARSELGAPGQALEHLDRIHETARRLTKAMDEIVWALNPQHDTLESLVNYLGRTAQDLTGAAEVRCRLDLPLHLPNWRLTADVRHDLFLAFKEAVHNAVKHSEATEVRVSLASAQHGFTVTVEDNGRGFDLEHVSMGPETGGSRDRPGGGNGLQNMRRRLEAIGGRCRVESRPGAGTRVYFQIAVADDK